ncbi:MAG: Gx transporter family protein [bacterium]|nr:Gx transporter family protein [bacterium]
MSKKITFIGCVLAFAVILGYIEFLLPISIGIPGVKLGLANTAFVFLLYKIGFKEAFAVNTARIILTCLLFGNILSAFYSICGGILSMLTMLLFKKLKFFGCTGISVIGGIFHNIGQLLAAKLILQTNAVFFYTPVLIISGVVTGFLIGIISVILIKKLRSVNI